VHEVGDSQASPASASDKDSVSVRTLQRLRHGFPELLMHCIIGRAAGAVWEHGNTPSICVHTREISLVFVFGFLGRGETESAWFGGH
jgi:hypothetical protein